MLLRLVHLLYFLKTNHLAKLPKLDSTERFGENISQLLVSPDELHFKLAIVCILPD